MASDLANNSMTSVRRTATGPRAVRAVQEGTEKKRSWSEQRRIFEKEMLPIWRHVRVQDITRKEIRALVQAKAETAPTMANCILARISRLLSFPLERDWISANPAFRIKKPGEERSRERVLTRVSRHNVSG
jgi:hypothetical protein